jgi:hypothetical protein
MRAFCAIVVVLVVMTSLSACGVGGLGDTLVRTGAGPSISGSGKMVETSFDISGFNAVDVAAGASAQITKADTPSVKITTDDNAVDYLKVEKRGDTLVIGLKPGSFRNVTIKAAITMPELLGVSASGGSRVDFDAFTTAKPVAFNTSGGAAITGKMNSGPAKVTASGGADLTLTGQGESLTINHSGGGSVKLGEFAVGDANVDVSGGADSEINASGKVTGSVSGGSQLRIMGKPASVEVKKSGGGSVAQ